MLNYTGLENKDVLVVGLAKSGYEAAKLLSKLGAKVTVNDGKDLILESGLARLIDKWAKGICLSLNTPVTQINWEKDYIEIYTQSKKYICKSVLLTVSNGILQNEDITFIPQLPNDKIQESIICQWEF